MTISSEQVDEWLKDIAEAERDLAEARLFSWTQDIATILYAQAVSKPLPVNDPESHPDYEQIAKECFQRAKDTTPYLLREMGLLPKEGE